MEKQDLILKRQINVNEHLIKQKYIKYAVYVVFTTEGLLKVALRHSRKKHQRVLIFEKNKNSNATRSASFFRFSYCMNTYD